LSKSSKLAYPTRNIDDGIDSMKKAYETGKKTVFTRQEFADSLGMSIGGAYNVLVGSLSSFKLVETGNGQVAFTELGKSAVFGNEEEIKKAKEEAVRNITLFSEIYGRFGENVSSDQVRIYLKNDLAVDLEELDSLTSKVILSLKSNLHYFTLVKQNDKQNEEPPKGNEEIDMTDDDAVLGDTQALIISKLGRIKIVDEQSLAMARGYLPGLMDYIESKLREQRARKESQQPNPKIELTP
jgi:hypothetical protein